MKGEGKGSQPADDVVAAIRANGGTAVANYGTLPAALKGMSPYIRAKFRNVTKFSTCWNIV